MSAPIPVEIRIAALRAIIELDTIKCGSFAPCVGPVERAVSFLLAIAVRLDGPEDFSAVDELAAALKELEPKQPCAKPGHESGGEECEYCQMEYDYPDGKPREGMVHNASDF